MTEVPGDDSYRFLRPHKIVETAEKLSTRIRERFPESSLYRICEQLKSVAAQADERSSSLARPYLTLRIALWLSVLIILAVAVAGVTNLHLQSGRMEVPEFVEMLDAGMNAMVLAGAAIFFLMTLETRHKRKKALVAIDELRAIAHIIDMHQLTKDPERVARQRKWTESSPESELTQFELARYLDYCSEMLSITGKVAALYVQQFRDPVVIAATNEIEQLCTGLSQKIWQKIMILQQSPDYQVPD